MPPRDWMLEGILRAFEPFSRLKEKVEQQERELDTTNYTGPLGRVRWKSRVNNTSGHGSWIPLAVAQRAADEGNRMYAELVHLVEVKEDR